LKISKKAIDADGFSVKYGGGVVPRIRNLGFKLHKCKNAANKLAAFLTKYGGGVGI